MPDDDARRDAVGVVHPIAPRDARIVSLVPSLTELLFELDLGAQIVGRTGFCIHPRHAVRRVPKVGGTKDVAVDRVHALAPTHLVVNIDENRRETVDALARDAPHVIVTHPLAPDDNLHLYRMFGAIFGRREQADALAARYVAARDALRAAVAAMPDERVLYLIWRKPWYTVARSTYVSAMLDLARWRTVPAVSLPRYPVLADDAPEWHDADRVLLSSEPYAFRQRDASALAATLRNRGGSTPVTLIDGAMTSWYGSRAVAGLSYLADLRRNIARP
jgi:ABC-type Fe3+-hydroxamate transport system substrate-binding protein